MGQRNFQLITLKETPVPTDTIQTYWLGEGCRNAFVLLDLLQTPKLFQYEFLEYTHRILMREERDDALILLPHASTQQHLQVKMLVLEPDQSLAAFCGNGARVVAAYLQKFYSERYQRFSIVAHNGEHELSFFEDGEFGVNMPTTKLLPDTSAFVSEQAQNAFRKHPEGLWVSRWIFTDENTNCFSLKVANLI